MSNIGELVESVATFAQDTKILGNNFSLSVQEKQSDYIITFRFRDYIKCSLIGINIHTDVIKDIIKSNFTFLERIIYGKLLPIVAVEAITVFVYSLMKNISPNFYSDFKLLHENNDPSLIEKKKNFMLVISDIIQYADINYNIFKYPYIHKPFISEKRRRKLFSIFLNVIEKNIKKDIKA